MDISAKSTARRNARCKRSVVHEESYIFYLQLKCL